MDPSAVAAVLLGSAVVSAPVTAVLGHWNELSRAREERRQERLAETYLDVVQTVITACDWVDRTHPLVTMEGAPGPPEIPTDDQQRLLRARLSAYGSSAMQAAYGEVMTAFQAFIQAVTHYELVEVTRTSTPERREEVLKAIFAVRAQQVRPAGAALLKLANAELAERRLGISARMRARFRRVLRRNHAEKPEG
jgi:hypothetical protein